MLFNVVLTETTPNPGAEDTVERLHGPFVVIGDDPDECAKKGLAEGMAAGKVTATNMARITVYLSRYYAASVSGRGGDC